MPKRLCPRSTTNHQRAFGALCIDALLEGTCVLVHTSPDRSDSNTPAAVCLFGATKHLGSPCARRPARSGGPSPPPRGATCRRSSPRTRSARGRVQCPPYVLPPPPRRERLQAPAHNANVKAAPRAQTTPPSQTTRGHNKTAGNPTPRTRGPTSSALERRGTFENHAELR